MSSLSYVKCAYSLSLSPSWWLVLLSPTLCLSVALFLSFLFVLAFRFFFSTTTTMEKKWNDKRTKRKKYFVMYEHVKAHSVLLPVRDLSMPQFPCHGIFKNMLLLLKFTYIIKCVRTCVNMRSALAFDRHLFEWTRLFWLVPRFSSRAAAAKERVFKLRVFVAWSGCHLVQMYCKFQLKDWAFFFHHLYLAIVFSQSVTIAVCVCVCIQSILICASTTEYIYIYNRKQRNSNTTNISMFLLTQQ